MTLQLIIDSFRSLANWNNIILSTIIFLTFFRSQQMQAVDTTGVNHQGQDPITDDEYVSSSCQKYL